MVWFYCVSLACLNKRTQGCESSYFQLISSFFKMSIWVNFIFFFYYFQPLYSNSSCFSLFSSNFLLFVKMSSHIPNIYKLSNIENRCDLATNGSRSTTNLLYLEGDGMSYVEKLHPINKWIWSITTGSLVYYTAWCIWLKQLISTVFLHHNLKI